LNRKFKSLYLFNTLSEQELSKVSSIAEEVTFRAGEHIVEEGKSADFLYIVDSGTVNVKKGKVLDLKLGKGALIGELSFIDNGSPSADVVAAEDVTLIRIPFNAFDRLIREDKGIAYNIHTAFLREICGKLRDTNELFLNKDLPSSLREKSRIVFVI
jgi:CRP-like cAMP-binding protein